MRSRSFKILIMTAAILLVVGGMSIYLYIFGGSPKIEPLTDVQPKNNVDKIKGLIRELEYVDWFEMKRVKQELIIIGRPAVPFLVEKLKDTNARWETLSAVADVLVELGDTNAIRPVLKRIFLSDEEDARITALAGIALAKMGDETVFGPLIERLNGPISNIRYKIVETLGEIGEKRAVEPLIKLLNPKEEKSVRGAAASALAKLGDKRAVDPLIEALKYEDNIDYSRYIVAGYGKSPVDKALVKLGASKDQLIGGYINALTSPNKNIRQHAVFELADLVGKNNVEAVEPLLEVLINDNDAYTRMTTASTLGKIGDIRAVVPLINTFNGGGDVWLTASAAYALAEIGDRRAEEHLIKGLNAGITNIIDASAYALGKIGDERTADRLIEYLQKRGVSFNTINVVTALGDLGNKNAVEPLSKLLNHEEQEYYIPAEASKALAKLGDKRAVDPLLEALKFDNYGRQFLGVSDGYKQIEEALKELGATKEQMVAGYVYALLNPNSYVYSYVRQNAARKLGELGDIKAVVPLIKALGEKDRKADEYEEIVSALVKLRDRRAVEPLIKALEDDENHWFYKPVIQALGELGDKRAMEALAKKLEVESSGSIHSSIKQALKKIEVRIEKEARRLIEEKLDPQHHHLIKTSHIRKVIKLDGKFKVIYDEGIFWESIIIKPESMENIEGEKLDSDKRKF